MKTVVMTGATSGIGKTAALQIVAMPDTELLIGTRGLSLPGAQEFPLDLSRLASVREFISLVRNRLGNTKIDVLILNAGVNLPNDDGRTEDGYESTFAVNHLAHYLILRSLDACLAPKARVIITTSDTHDPKVIPIAPPRHADAKRLARPAANEEGRELSLRRGFRAYSTSKLCNLLTARAFAALPETTARDIVVVAYNPGLTPGTGLVRNAPAPIRILMEMAVAIQGCFQKVNTVDVAGTTLTALALGRVSPPDGRMYASLVRHQLTWPDPSELALRDEVRDSLWRDSAELVGIRPLEA